MEECECLCSRVAILVAGHLKCLGSIQNLRQKYGQGYTLTIKLNRDLVEQQVNYVNQVKRYVVNEIVDNIELRDYHETILTYHVNDEDKRLSWTYLFEKLEQAKLMFNFEDYAVSDTTLEQIFIYFARQAHVLRTRL